MPLDFCCDIGAKSKHGKILYGGHHVEDRELEFLVEVMGCKVGSWPMKYLGMLLGGNPRAVSFWDPVVEKVSKKMACCKRSYISLGERITLIKASLSNLLVYYMSLFTMPYKVVMTIEKLQSDFLWEGGRQKKDHLVKWMQL